MLVLLPPTGKSINVREDIRRDAFVGFPLLTLMAKSVSSVLNSAYLGWTSLADYVEHMLGTGDEIFDLEAQDNLIFDDDLYTRSRRYFWVINWLNESENRLQENMQTWTGYRDQLVDPAGERTKLSSDEKKDFEEAIRKCDELLACLQKTKNQFEEQRTKAIALRDGVCGFTHYLRAF